MPEPDNQQYNFGHFALDLRDRTLFRDGESVPLAPKVFDTLAVLVARGGTVISKQELIEAVWPDSFVEESNLSQNIYTLRRLLANGTDGRTIIENVPRRGYRFNIPVDIPAEPATETRSAAAEPLAAAKPSSRRAIYVFAALVPLVAAAGLWLYLRPLAGSIPAASAAETASLKRLTFAGITEYPVLAPNGRTFAFVRNSKIVLQDVDSGEESTLAVDGARGVGMLQFSPDGASIYFRERPAPDFAAKIFRVSVAGGSPDLVVDDVAGGVGVSPDGTQLAFMRFDPRLGENPALFLKNLKDSSERKVLTLPRAGFLISGHPAFSTDGKKIALAMFDRSVSNVASQLAIFDPQTNEFREIVTPRLKQVEQAVWLDGDGELIVVGREKGRFFQLWRVDAATGKASRVTNDLTAYRGVSMSNDGKRLLARQESAYTNIWIADKSAADRPVQMTFENMNRDGLRGVAVGPAGEVIYNSRVAGDQDIFVVGPDGSRRQITKDAGEQNQNPVASPDGRQIYFSSNRTGSIHIWRADVATGEQTQVTSSDRDTETFPQLSPDGQTLYFIRHARAGRAVIGRNLADGSERSLTQESIVPAGPLRISPDGRYLAFIISAGAGDEDDATEGLRLGILGIGDSAKLVTMAITSSRPAFDWSPKGDAIDYIRNSEVGASILRQPLSNTNPAVIASYPGRYLHSFAWSRDGSQLGLALGKQSSEAILFQDF